MARKLSKMARDLVFGGSLVLLGGGLYQGCVDKKASDENSKDKTELSNQKSLPKYKITDKESFRQLYEAALPLAQLSMFPTEILVLNAYSDNNSSVSNTIGLGSYYYPKDGNPQSSEWILTKTYAKQHKDLHISGDKALQLSDGWCRYREGGRIYNAMYNRLNGCELTINEFAALFSRTYNNETFGLQLCRFVRENHHNPIKCAHQFMCFEPGENFRDGILKRDASEALLYLNHNDYASKIGELKIKKGTNSKGNTYYVTSITQLNPTDCETMKKKLKKGDLSGADIVCHKITKYLPKGGKSVRQIINSEVKNKQTCESLLQYDSNAVDYLTVQADNSYQKAMEEYTKGNYSQTLTILQNIIDQGFDGADIHNDMAITYYHLGEYDNCITECRKVLSTGETEYYPAANFNAGLAYEKLGNKQKALINYKLAQARNPSRPEYKSAVNRLSPPKLQSSVKKASPTPIITRKQSGRSR